MISTNIKDIKDILASGPGPVTANTAGAIFGLAAHSAYGGIASDDEDIQIFVIGQHGEHQHGEPSRAVVHVPGLGMEWSASALHQNRLDSAMTELNEIKAEMSLDHREIEILGQQADSNLTKIRLILGKI